MPTPIPPADAPIPGAHPLVAQNGHRPVRGPVRRLLETRGLVGDFTRPHVDVSIRTDDGVRLVGTFLPGPHRDRPAVVLAHGFAARRRKPAYARLADRLADHVHVLSLDLRGHGSSGGQCTLGDREAADVAAAVGWLRRRSHPEVAIIGASMGGTSVLHALALGVRAEAAVTISAPAVLVRTPASLPMERMRRVWESPAARAGLRWGLGVDVVPPGSWSHPGDPRDLARGVTVPLLVVHGDDDDWFPPEDALALAAAAHEATLWVEPAGFGHAEDGFDDGLADRIGVAIQRALSEGRFPEREEVAR